MTQNDLSRLSTVALTHKYTSDFVDDIGWESWMDEYCEDPESITEGEIARIDEELKRIWNEAWYEYAHDAVYAADKAGMAGDLDAIWSIYTKLDDADYGWSADVMYKPDRSWTDGDVVVEICGRELTIRPEFDDSEEYWDVFERNAFDYNSLRKHLVSVNVSWS
jgi:hypothetical protein